MPVLFVTVTHTITVKHGQSPLYIGFMSQTLQINHNIKPADNVKLLTIYEKVPKAKRQTSFVGIQR